MHRRFNVVLRSMLLVIIIMGTPGKPGLAQAASVAPGVGAEGKESPLVILDKAPASPAPEAAPVSDSDTPLIRGPITVSAESSASSIDIEFPGQSMEQNRTANFVGVDLYTSPPFPKSSFPSGLTITPITAYNLIVDSNVLSPSSYGPSAATLGAQFCNTTGSAMTDVWAYVGDFNADNDSMPGEAGDLTPGTYPVHNQATDPAFNAMFPHLTTAPTQVDYGDLTRFYALEQESGSSSDTVDASRYIGDLAAGECRTEYWLVSYPRKALIGGNWVDVTGGVQPEDDLWLTYFFWATSNATGANPSYIWNPVTMRNEISASANKIWPNGDNKVPDEYIAAIQQTLGWDTWTPNGSGTLAYPGETVVSQGIWYDLGNVGAGFDNNGDFVPDRNIWVQPIGDSGAYDPGCFRLVRTYGLVIVKLNDGTELLIPFVDQMYFESIPENNNGAVGLVYYEYIALDGACTAGLTPYQEVASGYDNEKFNADFGAGIPPLQSQQTNMTFNKDGLTSIGLGGRIDYTMTFTLPDVNPTDSMVITVGNPSLGMPLTYYETVPSGLQYFAGSASAYVTMTNYFPGGVPTGSVPATRLWSTNSGATWSTTDPGNVTSTAPNNLVIIQWQLDQGITSPATGPAVMGRVSFSATVPGSYTPSVVNNTSCLKLGNAECFVEDTHTTLVTGTARIEGTVWRDDATGGGILGNGIQDGAEAGIGDGADLDATGVTVNLYWDANGDGDHTDAGDFLYTTTTSDNNGNYAFTSLPATSGSARYLIEVDDSDSDIPPGYGPTTATSYTGIGLAAGGIYGDGLNEPSDFGFAPALDVEKRLDTTGTIRVGDTVQYTIAVSNMLPGSGAGSAMCEYAVWAGSESTSGAPATGSGTSAWQNVPYALGRPDNRFSTTIMSNSTDIVGLTGFNMGQQAGNITSVRYVVRMKELVDFGDDQFIVRVYYGDILARTDIYLNATLSSPIGTVYELEQDITSLRAWNWADFQGNLTEMQIEGNRLTGDSGDAGLDAAGFVVTTDQPCGDAGSVLNPVPLTDDFDELYLQFISASPPVSQAAAGLLTWDNVGPIYPGQTRYITVTMRALAATSPAATDNTAESQGAEFANGLPANSPANDMASATIAAAAGSRAFSGTVFDDNSTPALNGWSGVAWTRTGSETGYDSLGTTDLALPYVPVDLYACYDASSGALVTTPDSRPCRTAASGGDGEWRLVRTTFTDSDGNYSFTNLGVGFYYAQVNASYVFGPQVADVNMAGMCTTCDSRSNNPTADDVDAAFIGNLLAVDATRVNFGYDVDNVYRIGDHLFYDWDGNGAQDAADEPIAGVTLQLLGADGSVISSMMTGQDGNYEFSNRLPAYYRVQVDTGTLPASVVQTYDPDGTLDDRSTFALTADDLTRDFGYQPTGSGTIGDTVWRDTNGNGSQSSSEPGIPGVTVTLQVDLNGDGTYVNIATAVTDASGKYLFTDLPQGTYRVALERNGNSGAIPNDAFGNDYLPSTGTTSGSFVYQTVTLPTSTSSDLSADFGFAPPASIGDTVYYDLNGNGTQDFTEAGIDGVTVTLYTFTDDITANGRYDPGETLGSEVSSTTTVNGAYQFDGLVPGYYVVQVTPPANTTLTGDPNMDGVPCAAGEPLCDHRDGMRLYNGTNYTGADFGYQPLGVIGDTLWIDTDDDGVRDVSEQGIANVTVRLCSDVACGTVVQSTTTDPDGYYSFGSVPDGTYYVVVGSGVPTGLTPTYNDPDDTLVDNVTRVVLAGGLVSAVGDDADPACANCSLDVDFGYRYEGPLDLSGTICLENASPNGVCGITGSGIGANEAAYANVVVYLYVWNDDGDGLVEAIELTQIASVQTEADGDYSFENIPGGTYYVVALGAPQDDIELTTTQLAVGSPTTQVRETTDSDGNTISAYQVVQVGATNVENRDFAFEADPLDYGDLPASYSTRVEDTPAGASHTVPPSPNLYLGSTPPDTETNGSPTVDATGDGADEDGVTLVGVWGNGAYNAVNGTGGAVGVTVNGSGYLAGWIDFNRDGDFNDAGEMIVHQAVSPGTANYTFDIPADTFAGPGDPADLTLYARFRLFDAEPLFPSLAYSGAAGDGEVEDYAFHWLTTVDKNTATPTVTPTGTVIYPIALVNWGDGTLTNLQATDILPDFNGAAAGKGYTVLDVSATGGLTVNFPGFDGDTNPNLLAAGNSLPARSSRAITITLTLSGAVAGTYDNTVTVSSAQTGTFDDDGPVAQDAGTPPTSDPEIDEDVTVGSNGSLVIVKNALPDDAQDFAYTVSGTGLTPFTLDDDVDAALSNTQTFNSLAGGGIYTVTETTVAGWSVTNISCTGATSSTVTIGAAGGFEAGDTAVSVLLAAGETVTCTFENTAILSVVTTKTADDTSIPETGQSVTYTVEVENTGPVEVTLDSLTDDIFHDLTTTGHDHVTATTCATGGALAPGATYMCAFAATVSGTFPGTHVNTVTAQVHNGSNTASDADDATVTFEDASPELTVVKSSSAGGTVHAGDTITYTVTITNTGNVTQNNIAVSDAQPAGTTYVNYSSLATGYVIGAAQTYLDQFGVAQFNNSNGTATWAGTPWTETGDNGIANSGKIQINTSTTGTADFQATAPTDVLTLTRPVNLTNAASATLTYFIAENGINSAADTALVQVWNGTAWTTVATYTGDFTGATGNTNILAYASADTQIRFVVTGFDGGTQNLVLDNVQVQFTTAVATAKDNNPFGGVPGSLTNGSPPTLLFPGDDFGLLPGQSMTVSYQATVNNPVPVGQTQVVNIALVTSVEIVTPVQATVTDDILTAPITLTLRKTWTNAILNDAVDVTAAVGGVTIDTLSSTANTANETDTDLTPVNVTVGQTITFGETFTTGNVANYISSVACTGAIDKDLSDGLTVDAADTAIVCTETNTRQTATLTLQKTWVGAAMGDTATVDLSGTNNDSLSSTAASANETDVDATPTTVYAGETVTINETLGAGNTASYTGTLACSGTADTDLTGGELTVDPADTAITCTYTNSAVLDPPSIAKSFSPNPIAVFGTSTLTFVITNPNPGAALSGVAFVDNYPGGLVNMNPVSTTNTCGGSLTALSDDDFISLSGGSIAAGGSCTITVLVMAPSAGTYVNTTGNVSSTNGGTGNTATATLGVMSAAKSVVGTSEPSSPGTDVLIGEVVRYRLIVDLPEGTTTNLQVLDHIVDNMAYRYGNNTHVAFVCNGGVGCASSSDGSIGSGPVMSGNTGDIVPAFLLPASAITNHDGGGTGTPFPDGDDPLFSLGTVTNNDRDADPEYVVIELDSLVLNTTANVEGVTRGNTFDVIVNGTTLATSNDATVTIREPVLDVVKSASTLTPAPGPLTFTLTIAHAAGSQVTAYDVNVSDAMPAGLDNLTTVNASYSPSGCTIINTISFDATSISATIDTLPPGCTVTLTYEVTVSGGAGDTRTNDVDMNWTSLPDVEAGERTGADGPGGALNDYADTAAVTVTVNPLNNAVISDRIWNDVDGDGVQDGGETGMGAGIRVYLDNDNDNVYDAGEPSDLTDVSGIYAITGLAAGTYNVRVDTTTLPADYTQTYDLDGALDHEASVTLAAGETRTDVDFGYQQMAVIGDQVWLDLDADGIQDGGSETGLAGVTVTLLDGAGNPVDSDPVTPGVQPTTTLTNASGFYSFIIRPGFYIVEFGTLGGYIRSPQDQGADNALDSDASVLTGRTAVVTMAAGEVNNTVDAGMYQPGTVSGHLYIDTNGNGIQNVGEPDLANVDVIITPASGAPFVVASDANGDWTATVLPGSTTANVDEMDADFPAGSTRTEGTDPTTVTAVAGTDTDAGNDGYHLPPATATLTLQKTVTNDNGGTALDTAWTLTAAGPSTISGTEGQAAITGAVVPVGTYTLSESGGPGGYTAGTWSCAGAADLNPNDGLALASGETVTCTITNNDNPPSLTLDKIVVNDHGSTATEAAWTLTASGPTTLSGTGAAGAADVVSGAGFSAGTYTLSESGPAGYAATAWTCTNGVTVASGQITLGLGQTTVCSITNDDLPASIGDYVWNDADGQGDQDEAAAGLNGVTVNVYRDDGDGIFEPGLGDTLAGTDVTDGAGAYNIAALSAGAYFVDVLGPAGYTLTTANDPLFVLLALGQNYTLADFGFQQTNATISDYLWNDANGDGLQAGESGLGAGIRVYVDLNHDDSYDVGEPTDLTDASGLYAITGLPAGAYDVRVANPPAGYLQTYDLDGTGTSNEASVTVTAGQTRTDVDFGYQVVTPRLTIEKSSTTSSLSAPGTVTYNYLVTNTGNVALTGISLSDDNDNDDITCPATTLAPAGTMTCTATHTFTQAQLDSNGSPAAASGVLANTVTASSNEAPAVTDSLDIPISQNPAINIAKTPGTQTVISGGTANFTLAVTNTGNVTLTGVIVTDAQCTALPVYIGGDANSDGRLQFTETWTYSCSTINVMSSFTNTASVSTTQGATDSDTASVTVTVPQADLELTKLVSNAAPYVATDITFTLNIVNRGPDAATGVTVTDVIPTGFTYISDDGGGSYDPATGVWTVGSLANGATRSLTITVRVNVSGSYVNYAQVASSSLTDPDSTPNNNSTDEDDDASVTVTPATGDPSGLDKAVVGSNEASTTNPNVAIGEIVTYRVSVVVPPGIFANARLVDTMERGLSYMDCAGITPSGMTTDVAGGFASICANPTVDNAGGTTTVDVGRRVTFDFGTLTNGTGSNQSLEVTYRTVVLDSAGNLGNGAAAGTSLRNSALWTWGAAGSLGPASETLVVVEPDLVITKTASTTVVSVGSEITITLTIQHTGDSETNAHDVIVTDDLPAELQYVPGSLECISGAQPADMTCVEAGGTIVAQWSNFTLTGGDGRVTFRVAVLSLPAAGIVNTANAAWTSLPGVPASGPGLPPGQQNANIFSTERGYDPGDLIDVYGASSVLGIGVPGGGGGGRTDRKSGSSVADHLPDTGFAPGRVTDLRNIPREVYIAVNDVTLEVPSLGITLPIVGVPLKDGDWNVSWLGKQAGWLEGTAFPSWSGNSVLTSHVYQSNGLPGPFVDLHKLKFGDQIIVHAYGQKYIFEVRENLVVEPDDTSVLKHETISWLTLITCKEYDEKADTYRKRVAVRAVLISVASE